MRKFLLFVLLLAPFVACADDSTLRSEKLFRWYGFRVYRVSLEVSGISRPEQVLSDAPMTLRLLYFRNFKSEEIIEAADKLLQADETVNYPALKSRLALINAVYQDVGQGDTYTLKYVPGVGTSLLLNERLLVTIPGYDFAKAYLGMWLGPNPISAHLRDHLLNELKAG